MIPVTHLDGRTALLNPELIVEIMATPDTVITLANGHRLMVREQPEELARRILAYRRRLRAAPAERRGR